MRAPLCIDLFCGLGGWTEGFLAEGYTVIGFDIERHEYGDLKYPGFLVIEDVLTLDGARFKNADVIVASPPCQEFSYMAMPWSKGKTRAREYRDGTRNRSDLTRLFDSCFRIQRQASDAAGRRIPLIVENVRGAQPWVGNAAWNFGSFYLWGDVPALMPVARRAKVPGLDWSQYGKPGYKPQGFNVTAAQRFREGQKTGELAQKRCGASHTRHLTNQREHDGVKGLTASSGEPFGKNTGPRMYGSKSDSRKAAAAQIAKIPLPLARHIARAYYPQDP